MGYKTLLTHESSREAEATSNGEGIAAIQPPSSFHQAVELMPGYLWGSNSGPTPQSTSYVVLHLVASACLISF